MSTTELAPPTVPIIVAEISANHRGSLVTALSLIEAIADAGATHVKFQTYKADTLTLDCDAAPFRVVDSHALWGGRTLHSLYGEAHTPWEWHEELFEASRERGLTPFSSPFDSTAVDFLETLEPLLYKVASLEIGDLPLIRRIVRTGRPVILSTGAATLAEVDEAVEAALTEGCTDLTLLVCTSSYPARPADAHLARMDFLRDRFSLPVGLSDHTLGIGVSIAASTMGAVMIERHVTLRRADGGPDSAFSLEPAELANLVHEVSSAAAAIGSGSWVSIEAEDESRRLRRSLYVTEDTVDGEEITLKNIRSIRPAGGLPPKFLDEIVGRRFARGVPKGTPLTWDLIQGPHVGANDANPETTPAP